MLKTIASFLLLVVALAAKPMSMAAKTDNNNFMNVPYLNGFQEIARKNAIPKQYQVITAKNYPGCLSGFNWYASLCQGRPFEEQHR